MISMYDENEERSSKPVTIKTINIDASYNKPYRKISYREENSESQ